MPVMDGLEATRRIKETAAGKKTPVIALTAHAFEEERRQILEAGCDDLIRKPFQEGEIFSAMSRFLDVQNGRLEGCRTCQRVLAHIGIAVLVIAQDLNIGKRAHLKPYLVIGVSALLQREKAPEGCHPVTHSDRFR